MMERVGGPDIGRKVEDCFGLFSIEKRCLTGNLITVFQHFVVSYRED